MELFQAMLVQAEEERHLHSHSTCQQLCPGSFLFSIITHFGEILTRRYLVDNYGNLFLVSPDILYIGLTYNYTLPLLHLLSVPFVHSQRHSQSLTLRTAVLGQHPTCSWVFSHLYYFFFLNQDD